MSRKICCTVSQTTSGYNYKLSQTGSAANIKHQQISTATGIFISSIPVNLMKQCQKLTEDYFER